MAEHKKYSNLDTVCVRGGAGVPAGGTEEHILHSHTFPIFQSSTFVFDNADHGAALFGGKKEGHIYGRIGNPTVERLEALVAELEKGANAAAFGSGMAAVAGAVMPFVAAGDHVVCSRVMYGPSVQLYSNVLKKFGVDAAVVDTTSNDVVRAAVIPGRTKVVYVETPGNPLTTIADLRACAEIAHAAGAILVVDNTFATPIFQRPIELGADVVLHSVTKYLNGHGDVVGGIVVSKTEELHRTIRKWRQDTGGIMGPFDAFLVARGLRTLALRMERHNANAMAVASYLEKHPKVVSVTYPGLASHAQHALAASQMSGFGGTFSVILKSFDAAKRFIEHTRLAVLAVSLGCVDTLIEHPASMTHASVPVELMKEQGLCPELVRISIGIENPADIIADLEQALSHA